MLLSFLVGETPVEFFRDPMTGRAEARTPGGTLLLQDPLNPGTHFSLSLIKNWSFKIADTEIVIEKKRKLLLAGLRPSRYRVFVGGEMVLEQEAL